MFKGSALGLTIQQHYRLWFCVPVVCQAFEDPEVSCLAYYPRWRYDPTSGQCENFIYGGCGGNANNFENFEDCDRKCIQEEAKTEVDNTVDNRYNTWRGQLSPL